MKRQESNTQSDPHEIAGAQHEESINIKSKFREGETVRKKKDFPWKLHMMLEDAEREHNQHIISWHTNGLSFKVYKPEEFVKSILPRYFNQTQFRSFQRMLNLYNFQKVLCGPTRGGYAHAKFLKENRPLCLEMRIRPKNHRKPSSRSSSFNAQDFFEANQASRATHQQYQEAPQSQSPPAANDQECVAQGTRMHTDMTTSCNRQTTPLPTIRLEASSQNHLNTNRIPESVLQSFLQTNYPTPHHHHIEEAQHHSVGSSNFSGLATFEKINPSIDRVHSTMSSSMSMPLSRPVAPQSSNLATVDNFHPTSIEDINITISSSMSMPLAQPATNQANPMQLPQAPITATSSGDQLHILPARWDDFARRHSEDNTINSNMLYLQSVSDAAASSSFHKLPPGAAIDALHHWSTSNSSDTPAKETTANKQLQGHHMIFLQPLSSDLEPTPMPPSK